MCIKFDEIEFIALLNLEVKQMNVAFCNCQPHKQPTMGCLSVKVVMMVLILSDSVVSNMICASFVVICYGLDGCLVHLLSYEPFIRTLRVKFEAREDGENCCEVMMSSIGRSKLVAVAAGLLV